MMYDDVRDFHVKFGHPAPDTIQEPTDMEFRIKLIEEECEELVEAIMNQDLPQIAAEAVDLIYVVIGTLVALGLPLLPFWKNVHQQNMLKIPNPSGGKPLKPKGWEKPNPERIIRDL